MRVRARLANAVVGGDLHLDGILGWVAWQRLMRAGHDLPAPNLVAEPVDFELPLARWRCEAPEGAALGLRDPEDGMVWGWCASAGHAEWLAEETRNVRRKVEVGEMARRGCGGKLNTAGGTPIKHWDLPYPARLAEELTWWAVGDVDAVRGMLAEVHHVGKVHNHGAGEVLEWIVEPCEEDRSCVWDGRVMRALPATCADGSGATIEGVRRLAGVRPPYWHRARWCDALVPDGGRS